MLRAQGADVVAVAPADVRAEDAEKCAAVVLGPGVAGEALAAAVAARVRGGAGLLVLGGEKRAGLSRFRGTAIEPLLPVSVPPPPPPDEPPAPPPPSPKPDPSAPKPSIDEGEKEALRVALLLVIDTSGSMSVDAKLQMAQASAMAAARALSPEDRVSVIAFSDQMIPVAPFQNAVDMEQLHRRIAALRAEGQTNFHPALVAGFASILEERCGIRHVILLTDGETKEAVFQPLVEGAASKGVTLSTVAIGLDADTNRLARLATWGRGQMYLANDPQRLPEVVTLDTRRFATEPRDRKKGDRPKVDPATLPQPPSGAAPQAGKPGPAEPIDRTPAARRPHAVAPAAFLAGLEDAEWPALPFPETTTPRAASQVVLAWDDGAPALALGRAGLGRGAVIAAGATSPESRDFLRWPEAPRVLAQLVRSLVEPPRAGAAAVPVTIEEADDGRAFVRAGVAGGGVLTLEPLRAGAPVTARCADRGETSLAELSAMPARGVYAGTFSEPGGALRRVVAVSDGPREPDPAILRAVASASGAATVARVPAAPDGPPSQHDTPADSLWLAGAAAALLAESSLRRIARRTL
jgi:Ca-activated chloride channel family protein